MSSATQILELYYTTTKLKTMLREGWANWKVENCRVESIAEHVYGTLMLAVSICSHTKQEIDLEKVALMLALHEMEEIIIGDLAYFDIEKRKTKRADGKAAVEKLFNGCIYKERFLEIIEEFESKETPEARFAYQCDKLEADLQAQQYANNFNYNNIKPEHWNDDRVVEMRNNGITRVEQMFLHSDKSKFSGTFTDIANELEKMQHNNKAN